MIEPALSARFTTPAVEILLKITPHHTVFVSILLVYVLEDLLVLNGSPVSNRIGGGFFQMADGRLALASN